MGTIKLCKTVGFLLYYWLFMRMRVHGKDKEQKGIWKLTAGCWSCLTFCNDLFWTGGVSAPPAELPGDPLAGCALLVPAVLELWEVYACDYLLR